METAEISPFSHRVMRADTFNRDLLNSGAWRGLKPIWHVQMKELALRDLVGRGIGLPRM